MVATRPFKHRWEGSVYHETSTVYSRDAAVNGVRELQKVILKVKEGTFFPDALRSRYFGAQSNVHIRERWSQRRLELKLNRPR